MGMPGAQSRVTYARSRNPGSTPGRSMIDNLRIESGRYQGMTARQKLISKTATMILSSKRIDPVDGLELWHAGYMVFFALLTFVGEDRSVQRYYAQTTTLAKRRLLFAIKREVERRIKMVAFPSPDAKAFRLTYSGTRRIK